MQQSNTEEAGAMAGAVQGFIGTTLWRCLRGGCSLCSGAGCFSGTRPSNVPPHLSWVLHPLGGIDLNREAVKQSKRQELTPDPAAQNFCPAFAGLAMETAFSVTSNSQAATSTGEVVEGRGRGVCRPPAL